MSDFLCANRLTEGAFVKILMGALDKAREMRVTVGVAVIDQSDNLRAWLLMDDASPLTYSAALKKAKSATFLRQPTGRLRAEMAIPLALTIPEFTNFGGGLPILRGPELLGAIGV